MNPLWKGYRLQNLTRPSLKSDKLIGPEIIHRYPWARIIADEAQCFTNSKTVKFPAMLSLYGPHRWCLSGTPVRNSDKDMWSLLKFIGYSEIDNPKKWKYEIFEKKNKNLQDVILVRDYEMAGITLPEKIMNTYEIEMDTNQKEIYTHYFKETYDLYNKFMKEGNGQTFGVILGSFIRLRQICISPYLLTNESKSSKSRTYSDFDDLEISPNNTRLVDAIDPKINALESWVHQESEAGFKSGKLPKILSLLKNIMIKPGEKVLVYSSFSSCLDLIFRGLDSFSKDPLIFDGRVTGKRRQEYLESFRTNPDTRILLSNYKVEAEGLNLTQACHVICIEPWWTPVVESQAVSRAWRLGQTCEVHVHRLIVKGTIEEHILSYVRLKDQFCSHI